MYRLLNFPEPVDVSERYEREKAARELFQTVAEATSNIIVITRVSDETIVYVSPSVQTVAGYRPADLIGRPVKDIYVDPGTHTAHKAEIQRAGRLDDVTILLKTVDGAPIWAQTTSKVVALNGEPHIVSDLVDVAGRKELVEAVMESEARFRDFTETASDWLWEMDADLRFTLMSDSAPVPQTATVSWTAIGKTRAELYASAGGDPESDAAWRPHLAQLERREPFHDFRYWLLDAKGVRRHVSVSGKPIFAPDGTFKGYRGTGRDGTELSLAMESLRAAKEEAEAANAAKSTFLSAMSHELRTPLNAILGFAELIRTDQDAPVPETHRKDIEQILRSGRHLLDLIDEVLDLSRIEAGKFTMSFAAVSVGDLVTQTVPLVAALARSRNVSIDIGFAEGDGTYVRADATRLKQVLLNLLSNAVKYNVDGGRVTVRSMAEEDGRCLIAVSDTGIGLSAGDERCIFEPFVRVGRSAAAAEGTGIGLNLSKRLVELMDGEIGFESAEGVGSTFWIRLPTAKAAASPGPAKGASPPRLQGAHRVLYVEDDAVNIMLMERVLARHGEIELAVARSAEDAFDIVKMARPDVILMDTTLPGMSGVEATARLKANPATRAIPVIAVSANAMETDIRGSLDAGADAYVTKPMDFETFLTVLSGVLAAR